MKEHTYYSSLFFVGNSLLPSILSSCDFVFHAIAHTQPWNLCSISAFMPVLAMKLSMFSYVLYIVLYIFIYYMHMCVYAHDYIHFMHINFAHRSNELLFQYPKLLHVIKYPETPLLLSLLLYTLRSIFSICFSYYFTIDLFFSLIY